MEASEGARLEGAGADETCRVGWTRPLPPFVVLVFSFLSDISLEDHITSKFGNHFVRPSQPNKSLAMIPTLLLGLGMYLSWGPLGSWTQDPGTRFSELNRPSVPEGWRIGAEDTSRDPIRR